jgi:hypothetical protein
MAVKDQAEFEQVIAACWLAPGEAEHLATYVDPYPRARVADPFPAV